MNKPHAKPTKAFRLDEYYADKSSVNGKDPKSHRKETPKLKEGYTRQTLSKRIEAAILDSLTTDQLQAICDIIDPPKQQ